jgi:cytidylate kinase
MTVLLVSGAIAVGKTACASELSRLLSARLVTVRVALADVLGVDARDRRTLQRLGADLDKRTAGRWLKEYIEEHREPDSSVVVDSLRTLRQTVPLMDFYVDARLVYLEAHEETRRQRYAEASPTDPVKASVGFDLAMHHVTEQEVVALRSMADVVVETDELDPSQVATVALEALGLRSGSGTSE